MKEPVMNNESGMNPAAATELPETDAGEASEPGSPGPEPFIRVDRLSKIFYPPKDRSVSLVRRREKPPGFRAVNDVSFDVERGQTFVIMGLSGSGKSTVIRMLNRLIGSSEGQMLVDGKDVDTLEPGELRSYRNETTNMVFQHFALFPHKSLIENVSFGLKVRGIDKQAREDKAADALGLVGLGDRLFAMPDQLSGGMRQRVGLARALATDAEILLMDEPFSALDPLIRKDMQELLITLQQNFKKTIIFVTHDLNEAMHLGDRIMVMKQGEKVQLGTALDLLNSPADPYIEEFVAEVDRSRVLTAGMLATAGSHGSAGPHIGEFRADVSEETLLNDLLPLFAEGASHLNVLNGDHQVVGEIRSRDVFASLAPKGDNDVA